MLCTLSPHPQHDWHGGHRLLNRVNCSAKLAAMRALKLSKNFRENLRSAITGQGITQRELALRSGIHHVTICNILSGKMEPSLSVCESLAKAAKIKLPEIFSECR